ncbi:MAG TPA: hypothetical protein VLM75_01520 [Spirochaetota bacterium]|nr:hypothetical protein [Spirochaetota bacterium]
MIAFFNCSYVKTGKFDLVYSKYISSAFNIRTKGDYDDFYIASKPDAETQLSNANRFINAIELFIANTHGGKNNDRHENL